MDYQKLNTWTTKDHFNMSFVDLILECLASRGWYFFLVDYAGYNHISIVFEYQERTTFTYPYGTFIFNRMPSSLCNSLATSQHYVMSIFSNIE